MSEMTIWKYSLPRPQNTYGKVQVDMNKSAQIFSCQVQDGVITLWALVSPDVFSSETRVFQVIGTGHKFEHDGHGMKFIATVQQPPFVWHIFEDVS